MAGASNAILPAGIFTCREHGAERLMKRNWIAVASADHVQRGVAGGFMQIAHGKSAPLKRIEPGDCVIYYSPTASYHGREKLQVFTAIGIVRPGAPYQGDMGGGFHPFRRDVDWLDAHEAPIAPLLERLELSAGRRNWGARLRFGLLEISEHDGALIAQAMSAGTHPRA
jgi:hypothetical protein